MGNLTSVWWIVVECACRILGVSTAIVLCAVGLETLRQGEFSSLGIYLIVSSVGVMVFELAYFLDTVLLICLPCPPDWQLFMLLGKMARIGGFHKFLYYSIMSLVCFLHPMLVWHAIIPGTMLLVTAFFNFILSKKIKPKSPKRPQESYGDQNLATVCITGRRGGGLAPTTQDPSLSLGERGESIQAMLNLEQTAKDTGREQKSWKERRQICFRDREEPAESVMEMDGYYELEPDTSDTAPMITD
uniref:transmembrane protein 72 isoform X2 n=1 Tax=Monopterus albus TaxID=43700 RepID=UPI0009B31C00|nr:transmembrane protein 72 isoform X2 [Monopterus albus]